MSKIKGLLGLGPPCSIDVIFNNTENRRTVEVAMEEGVDVQYVFGGQEAISGRVVIKPNPGKRIEHQGVRIELIGQIVLTYERVERQDFTSVVRLLEPNGEITSDKEYTFDFPTVEKQFDSYSGINAQLRYFLRITITRSYATNITQEKEFWVENVQEEPQAASGIKMEVGIEDYLHIEFEYDKAKYSLNDVVLGKVFFILVRLKIKHMELAVVRRESIGSGPNVYNESETVSRFEIMDGNPDKGENVPVRLFLASLKLTPTYRNVNNKFSVKYYLNLVLVDEEDRRYFKQSEIVLWRQTANTHLPVQKAQ